MKKKELENLRNHRLIGSMVRSRAKWADEGEKPTNYFLNLENRHYTNKIIPKLIIEEENLKEITNQREILNEIESFYKNLYNKNDENFDYNLNEILTNIEIKTLNNKQRDSLEGEISFKEATTVVKNMANNKSPGSDGFTTEFYKVFLEQDRTFCGSISKLWVQSSGTVSHTETRNYYLYPKRW